MLKLSSPSGSFTPPMHVLLNIVMCLNHTRSRISIGSVVMSPHHLVSKVYRALKLPFLAGSLFKFDLSHDMSAVSDLSLHLVIYQSWYL